MGMFTFFRPRVATLGAQVDLCLLDELHQIGEIKNALLLRERGWCHELGLFVQLREARGMVRLQAGGKWKSKLDVWRDSPGESWAVRKYHPGNWEGLVTPTLHLARWLRDRRGLPRDVVAVGDFHSSVRMFRSTGTLRLPQNFHTAGETTELGVMIDAVREDDVVDLLPRIREYATRHGDDATSWDCLRRVCHIAGEHKEALEAALLAAQLAPHDGLIRYECAAIYFAALTNELRTSQGVGQLNPNKCTLEALDVTYEEAYSAIWQHLKAAIQSSMTGEHRKAAEMMVKFLEQ
jgi:hypothetical protein